MNLRVDALWGLTFITDCSDDHIQTIIDAGILPGFFELLLSHHEQVQLASMRLLGNITTGSNEQTDHLISRGLLTRIRPLLSSRSSAIRRTTLWCLSNIAAGPIEHLVEIIFSGLMPDIVDCCEHHDEKQVMEATLTIRNLVLGLGYENMHVIVESGAVAALSDLVVHDDEQISAAAKEALSMLFW
jgi:hypothetical protein